LILFILAVGIVVNMVAGVCNNTFDVVKAREAAVNAREKRKERHS
jgi:hypothetical protein